MHRRSNTTIKTVCCRNRSIGEPTSVWVPPCDIQKAGSVHDPLTSPEPVPPCTRYRCCQNRSPWTSNEP
ncbi:hypothetical protein CAPTEDRAFT_102619 [Capitella teleta]|uniref:Uncharacterized protein n=1 Tax=Capitella teleta TaxID=283909 RepID=R7UUH9_CAPTE|nr:hypothetical protein CAPTEDRAFT_102619 [Capitella teleta]|eukprot:ELU09850.1 hypothetical protein CAPTEDRAFT_102619 [Capitella teleta]